MLENASKLTRTITCAVSANPVTRNDNDGFMTRFDSNLLEWLHRNVDITMEVSYGSGLLKYSKHCSKDWHMFNISHSAMLERGVYMGCTNCVATRAGESVNLMPVYSGCRDGVLHVTPAYPSFDLYTPLIGTVDIKLRAVFKDTGRTVLGLFRPDKLERTTFVPMVVTARYPGMPQQYRHMALCLMNLWMYVPDMKHGDREDVRNLRSVMPLGMTSGIMFCKPLASFAPGAHATARSAK